MTTIALRTVLALGIVLASGGNNSPALHEGDGFILNRPNFSGAALTNAGLKVNATTSVGTADDLPVVVEQGLGPITDCNSSGIPDECEPACLVTGAWSCKSCGGCNCCVDLLSDGGLLGGQAQVRPHRGPVPIERLDGNALTGQVQSWSRSSPGYYGTQPGRLHAGCGSTHPDQSEPSADRSCAGFSS